MIYTFFSLIDAANTIAGGLAKKRPFEDCVDQPDTAERVRRQVQAIPFALPPKKEGADCP